MSDDIITDEIRRENDEGKSRAEIKRLRAELATVLAREAKTIARHDQRMTAADAEIERLRALVASLTQIVRDYYWMDPAFRAKPVGAPGSVARAVQDEFIALEDRAERATAKANKVLRKEPVT